MAIGIGDNRARRISRNIVIVKYREIAISWGIVCVDNRWHKNRGGKTSWRIVRLKIAYTINRGDDMWQLTLMYRECVILCDARPCSSGQ